VQCQNERSQHKTRKGHEDAPLALYEYELEKKRAVSKKLEDSKLEINFGSQIRSYVLQPTASPRTPHQGRGRRRGQSLDGYLEPFLRGYLLAKRREPQQSPAPTTIFRSKP